jgi:hypothetical protein
VGLHIGVLQVVGEFSVIATFVYSRTSVSGRSKLPVP